MTSDQARSQDFAEHFFAFHEVRTIYFSRHLQKIHGVFLTDIRDLRDQARRLDLILGSTAFLPAWKIGQVRGLNNRGMDFTSALTYPVGPCYLRVYRVEEGWSFQITRHVTLDNAADTLNTLLKTLSFRRVFDMMLQTVETVHTPPTFLEKYVSLNISLCTAPLVSSYVRGRIPYTTNSSLAGFAISLDCSLQNFGRAAWEIKRDPSPALIYHWHQNLIGGDSAFMCLTRVFNNWVFHLYDFKNIHDVMKALDTLLQFVQPQ